MARSTLKSALAGLALAGMLGATTLPNAVHAATPRDAAPPFQHDNIVGRHPVVYHDSFSGPGQYRLDQALGRKTHWEGYLNLSDPTSTLTWTRVDNSVVASGATVLSGGGTHVGVRPASLPHVQPHDIPSTFCGSTGGVRIGQNKDFNGGDCIEFQGKGSQDLHILYPGCYTFCSHVNDTASALSTATSGGSGQLACGGGLWTYQAFHYYADLSSGTPGCYHNASVIYIYT